MSIAPAINRAVTTKPACCYHCGEIISPGPNIRILINGEERRMCCHGCRAIAQAINEYGLSSYYRYRTGLPARPEENGALTIPDLTLYDDPEFQKAFVRIEAGPTCEASLIIDGIVCPACIWLNESHLQSLSGIISAGVNYTTGKATIRWNNNDIHLSEILKHIYQLGYRAYPYDPQKRQLLCDRENKTQLLRLGIAGLFGMQVMMIAVAFYTDIGNGLDPQHRIFLSWISLVLTLPVMFFSAQAFYVNAWRAICNRRMDMDQPVVLGISLAFLASVWSTLTGTGEVYYDTVTMLVFFLLAGRYLEFTARNRAALHLDILEKIIPAVATRLGTSDAGMIMHTVPVIELKINDRILIKPGEVIPVDGVILSGRTCVDESIVTGEATPLLRQTGDTLCSGSTNIDSPVQIKVTATGPDTSFSRICQLVEKAQTAKPPVTLFADRIAGWFLLSVLCIAAAAAWYWWHADRGMWLPVTVAILVVTCPCALSLATPVSISITISSLLSKGVAVINSSALQTMASITHLIFDKTGTLTTGTLVINQIILIKDIPAARVISIAQALEACSEHPLANAFRKLDQTQPVVAAADSRNSPGAGISGKIDNKKYFIGTSEYIRNILGTRYNLPASINESDEQYVLLASEHELLAAFGFSDELRPEAATVIRDFNTRGITTIMLSGDNEQTVSNMAKLAGITDAYSRLKPDDKLTVIEKLQQHAIVAMVGDGINDTPVMARADVALAMGNATDLTKQQADFILLGSRLTNLTEIHTISQRCIRIIRQNIGWALAYNLIALPAAVSGLLTPWMAALGMSASSLLVVLNSIRINHVRRTKPV